MASEQLTSIILYRDAFNEIGRIDIKPNEIVFRLDGDVIRSPRDYVKAVEKTGELPMSRYNVHFETYDIFGSRHEFDAVMADVNYTALKGLLNG